MARPDENSVDGASAGLAAGGFCTSIANQEMATARNNPDQASQPRSPGFMISGFLGKEFDRTANVVVSMDPATDPKAGGPIPRSTALAARGAPGLGCVSGRRDSRDIHLPPSANVLVGHQAAGPPIQLKLREAISDAKSCAFGDPEFTSRVTR